MFTECWNVRAHNRYRITFQEIDTRPQAAQKTWTQLAYAVNTRAGCNGPIASLGVVAKSVYV